MIEGTDRQYYLQAGAILPPVRIFLSDFLLSGTFL
jgi:hypothetical protein